MKQLILGLAMASSLTTAIAQNDQSKKVKTQRLFLPAYSVSSTDIGTLKAEFAQSVGTFSAAELKNTTSMCVPAGGGLKDAIEVKTHYYQLNYKPGTAYIIIKDAQGNILKADEIADSPETTSKFGHKKCEYWVEKELKKDWGEKSETFKASEAKKAENIIFNKARKSTERSVLPRYLYTEFNVYGAKGKDYDYSDLENAMKKAMTAYESIAEKGLNENDSKSLREAITVWEKELESLNLEDKKSRISRSIGKGLHENCARAYAYLFEYEKAHRHAREFKKLFKAMNNNRTGAFARFMKKTEQQKIATDLNADLVADFTKLNEVINQSKGKKITVKHLGSLEANRLSSEYQTFIKEQFEAMSESREATVEAAVADGTMNPYEKYVEAASWGPTIMMIFPPSETSGIPELTELPDEMCQLTDVVQVLITNNKIETVSSEIGNLKKLTKLVLTKNQLKSIPAEIGQLKNLKTLKLGNNPISSLPPEIANCTSLKTLDLKGTSFSAEEKAKLAKWLPKCKIKY